MSRKQIVILGGGTGGTTTANRLRRRFDADEAEIHVVDRDDRHVYQPGLLFSPGLAHVEEISGRAGANCEAASSSIRTRSRRSTERDEVLLDDGMALPYDVLVVATGVRLQPEETEGLTAAGWNERVFTFYNPACAEATQGALERFDGGRLVVNLVDMPIKRPVAPLEFAFADWHLRERGSAPERSRLRHPARRRRLHEADRLPAPGRPARREADRAGDRLQRRRVDGVGGTSTTASYDGRGLTSTCSSRSCRTAAPPTSNAHSDFSDVLGFVPTDKRTPQTPVKPNVFALGDATDLPTSKAGSVTHFEAEVLTENIARYLGDRELDTGYDGHDNYFIETGFHKALLIDFNYETELLLATSHRVRIAAAARVH